MIRRTFGAPVGARGIAGQLGGLESAIVRPTTWPEDVAVAEPLAGAAAAACPAQQTSATKAMIDAEERMSLSGRPLVRASPAMSSGTEPPVVAHHPTMPGRYLLLDGHLRIDILRGQGRDGISCLLATDDEAFIVHGFESAIHRLVALSI